ncbi:hypothetical protein [Candidatus Entotheonella palauensis]|uniref:hypothetical protein n=1 Tax=Candidatus Entotheonella palauensis TaxID=93172 RepID=UPI000B7CB2A7|nr:hypothetical protein [Candidatus Entotheonella palauensis]
MDYQIVFSPDLGLSPDSFIAAWNDDPECRDQAQASSHDEAPAGFPIEPGTALVFLSGVAATIATGVITNLISELLKKKFLTPPPASSSSDPVEILVIDSAPGTRLIVVKTPEAKSN